MAQLTNGWLVLKYDGPELATVQIKVNEELFDAYLDTEAGKRVAKIRPPQTPVRQGAIVEVWVNGSQWRAERFAR